MAERVAREVLTSGSTGPAELPNGVRLLDSWQNTRDGAVLFWIDTVLDPYGWGESLLHYERFELRRDGWHRAGGGGLSSDTAERLIARLGRGLHRLGGGHRDPLRLTVAIASPDVGAIELRSATGNSTRRPGADGFCLFGITFSDPITYAAPLDLAGRSLPGEPLLL